MTNVVTSPPPSHVASLGNPVFANNLAISTHHTYMKQSLHMYVKRPYIYMVVSLVDEKTTGHSCNMTKHPPYYTA